MDSRKKLVNEKLVAKITDESKELLLKFDNLCDNGMSENANLLSNIINDNQNTEFGQKHDFHNIHTIEDYKERVSLSTYDDYQDYIDRMVNKGESNLLTTYPIEFYAKTSGTSGNPKKIPVSDRGIRFFRNYSSSISLAVISEYYKESKGIDIPSGLRFMIVDFTKNTLVNGVPYGSISSAALSENAISNLEYIMTTPKDVLFCNAGKNLKYLHARFGLEERDVVLYTGAYIPALLDEMNYIVENWEMLVEDIASGTISPNIDLPSDILQSLKNSLTPNPNRADELRKVFSQGIDETIMTRIWPNLLSINAIWAGNFSSYARKLRRYTGESLPYYSMSYAASEGAFGIARHPYDEEYVLIPNSCVYEFIPIDDALDDENNVQPQTLLMDEIEIGKEYELVITNQSGLYRYRMGDIIRVTGRYKNTPSIEFRYRKKNIVSLTGEKVTEADLQYTIKNFENRTGILVLDFCMYPDQNSEPSKYIFFIETEEHIPSSQIDYYQEILKEELIKTSYSLNVHITAGNMGTPKLVFLKRGTFQKFREHKIFELGINTNQFKPLTVVNYDQMLFFLNMSRNAEGLL